MIRRRFAKRPGVMFFSVSMILLIIAACTPATPTAPPPPTRILPTATRFEVIVTLTPTLAPSPTLTPTLPYDIGAIYGNWRLDISYTLRSGPTFSNISFRGSAPLQVDINGNITGTVALYGTAEQPPCRAAVVDAQPQTAQITGTLHAEGSAVLGDLKITPDDSTQTTSLRMACADLEKEVLSTDALLWPALRATDGFTLSIPFTAGYVATSTRDLSGPTGGTLRGILITGLELNR